MSALRWLRLARAEVTAVGMMACALVALTAGLHARGAHARFDPATLGAYTGLLACAAAVLAGGAAWLLAPVQAALQDSTPTTVPSVG